MGLPRNIQEFVILTEEQHVLEYNPQAGEVNWRLRESSSTGSDTNANGAQDEVGLLAEETKTGGGRFREDEIVFIRPEPAPLPSAEAERQDPAPETDSSPPSRFVVQLVREVSGDESDGPYRLCAVSIPAGALPRELLDRHLLEKTPAHLAAASSAAEDDGGLDLYVVISTRSGTGLASAAYGAVLQKLLAELGLQARLEDDFTPPESPGGSDASGNRADGGADSSDRVCGRDVNPAAATYSLFVTKSRESIRDLARARWSRSARRQSKRAQLIILLSGDGGVVDLLNGAAAGEADDDGATASEEGETPPSLLPTVALLPLGTGNAMFHSLHRPLYQRLGIASASAAASGPSGPSHLVLGLRTLFRGVAAPLPTFRADFSPGSTLVPLPEEQPSSKQLETPEEEESHETVESAASEDEQVDKVGQPVDSLLGAIVASYGFHAQLVWESDTPAYRRHGAKRFGMAAMELLAVDHSYDAVVEVRRPDGGWTRLFDDDDKTEGGSSKGKLTYALAAMVSNLERTFTISPASRPLDGCLWLVSFGAVGAEKTMEIMQRAYDDGAHVGMGEPDSSDGKGGQEKKSVVGYEEVDEVRVVVHESDPRWRKLCIDGTIVEVPQGGFMSVRRMAAGSGFRILADPSVLGVEKAR